MSDREMARPRKSRRGFTLIELVIAMGLSSIILLGILAILTNMLQTEISSMRNGTVTAWSLASINVLNADISGASAVGFPLLSNSSGIADFLVVCTNWSSVTNASLPGAPSDNYAYTYCYDDTDHVLLRSVAHNSPASCPSVWPPPCTLANYPSDAIIATGVYRDASGDKIFGHDGNTLNAVLVHYVVGNPAAGAASAGSSGVASQVPISVPFDTKIILED